MGFRVDSRVICNRSDAWVICGYVGEVRFLCVH